MEEPDDITITRSFDFPNISDVIYTHISRNIASKCGTVTRSNEGPIACKISQFVYILVALLKNYYHSLYFNASINVHKFCNIYKKILIKDSPSYNFSVLNNPLGFNYDIITDDNFDRLFNVGENAIFTLGLVNTANNNKKEYPHGVINHYFIIICKDRTYYLISSYGSDYVCVPQTEMELDLVEFKNCVDAFNEPPSSELRQTIIRNFIMKYWLNDGRTVYLQDEDNSKKYTKILPEEGSLLETALYTESAAHKYQFYYFKTFVYDLGTTLQKLISSTTVLTGGKPRTIKKRKHKHSTIKKRKHIYKYKSKFKHTNKHKTKQKRHYI
jgi:hypothetical protein